MHSSSWGNETAMLTMLAGVLHLEIGKCLLLKRFAHEGLILWVCGVVFH
jgi:hypothetical protein